MSYDRKKAQKVVNGSVIKNRLCVARIRAADRQPWEPQALVIDDGSTVAVGVLAIDSDSPMAKAVILGTLCIDRARYNALGLPMPEGRVERIVERLRQEAGR